MSANGQVLVVTTCGQIHKLRAVWAAPFFVLVPGNNPEDRPLLIHCEDRKHADSHVRIGGKLLDATFNFI